MCYDLSPCLGPYQARVPHTTLRACAQALEKKAEQERLAKLIAEEQVAASPGNSTDRASGPVVVVRGVPIHKKDVEMQEVVSAKPVGVVGQSGVGSEAQAKIHATPS